MSKAARPRDHACPECGKMFSKGGLRGHLAFAHGRSLYSQDSPLLERCVPEAVDVPQNEFGPGLGSSPVDASETPLGADPSPAVAAEPAIGAEGLEALKAEPVEEEKPAAELGTKPAAGAERDYRKTWGAFVRRLDKLVSKFLGVEEESPGEVQDVIAMGEPGADEAGRRMGAIFWLACLILAVLSLAFAKAIAAQAKRRASLPPAGVAEDPTHGRHSPLARVK